MNSKVLFLLLLSSSALSMDQRSETRATLPPVIRDVTLLVVVIAASTIPALRPAAIVVGIGMRIAIDDRQYKNK
jgi:hypothetical protein